MPVAGSVGARTQKAIPIKSGGDYRDAPNDIGRPPAASVSAPRVQRVIVFCASGVLLALAAYIIAFYGFKAVVKCEIEQHRLSRQAHTVTAEIALTGGCGP
jgi:hypothetical protein